MKLIIREYISSLRERDELDAILPDLLSEMRFTVFSRPGRGTVQHGVDVAAVSPGVGEDRKVYLFSIKKGNLSRADWDGSPQALRSSLNEIIDVYIASRIPEEYSSLKVVICICVGGDIQEQVRDAVSGFIRKNTTERVGFEEWNGDRLSELILAGILKRELMPKQFQSRFQKAVAYVDEPDIAYMHFRALATELLEAGHASAGERVTAARRIYLCSWILFVLSREEDNIEAGYMAAELAILFIWDLLRALVDEETSENAAVSLVLIQAMRLFIQVAEELIIEKVGKLAEQRDALSMAVESQSYADINLKLFDLLGRAAFAGILCYWLSEKQDGEGKEALINASNKFFCVGLRCIENNAALNLPLVDDQGVDVALFLLLSLYQVDNYEEVVFWLKRMVQRYNFTVRTRGKYPTWRREYREIVTHPRNRSDEYFRDATAASALIPMLAIWLKKYGCSESLSSFSLLVSEELKGCTVQLWVPDVSSEQRMYRGGGTHGLALTDLPIDGNGEELWSIVGNACADNDELYRLSPIQTGFWPIVLLACRHWRLPVPPHFYVNREEPESAD